MIYIVITSNDYHRLSILPKFRVIFTRYTHGENPTLESAPGNKTSLRI